MELSHKDVETILALVERSGYDHVKLEFDNFKLEVTKSAEERLGIDSPQNVSKVNSLDLHHEPHKIEATLPLPGASAPKVPESSKAADVIPDGCIAIRSTCIGTFYHASSPDEPPFVVVGSMVNAGDVVGLVEIMKLFNSVHSSVSGSVLEIWVENGVLVEFGQVLIIIRPDGKSE
jgi:acetyl-CoA carboxylase biotin carboxyl carrier protein